MRSPPAALRILKVFKMAKDRVSFNFTAVLQAVPCPRSDGAPVVVSDRKRSSSGLKLRENV